MSRKSPCSQGHSHGLKNRSRMSLDAGRRVFNGEMLPGKCLPLHLRVRLAFPQPVLPSDASCYRGEWREE